MTMSTWLPRIDVEETIKQAAHSVMNGLDIELELIAKRTDATPDMFGSMHKAFIRSTMIGLLSLDDFCRLTRWLGTTPEEFKQRPLNIRLAVVALWRMVHGIALRRALDGTGVPYW